MRQAGSSAGPATCGHPTNCMPPIPSSAFPVNRIATGALPASAICDYKAAALVPLATPSPADAASCPHGRRGAGGRVCQ